MMFNRRLLLGILATIACATAQPSSTVAYTSIQGASYNLYPWFGQKIVILTRSNSLDPSVMAKMVSALDAAFVIYESITGSDPSPYPPTTLNGRDTIAEVPDGTTCGAGCTYIGANGSELASTYFTVLYNGVALHDEYDQVMFYEFGRSFWFYNPPLGKVDSFVTGFAIANRFTSMERIPVKGGPFNHLSFAAFHDSILVDLLDGYLANPTLTWRNTLLTGTPPPNANGWSAADLAGSMFYRIYHDYGLDAYSAFWRALAQQPMALTTDDTIRNFLAAASAATGRNYGFLFKDTFNAPASTPLGRVGIFRSGFFWLEDVDGNQQFNSPPDRAFAFGGIQGDIPINGDWNGSGTTKVGVYRPSNGLFVLDYDGDGQFTAADKAYNLGVGIDPTDKPVVGDWNGDGKTKVGLFRQGFFWILDTNGNGVFQQGIDQTLAFGGVAGDIPVVGDWNGNGTSKVGIFRQGFFWILDANGNGSIDNVNGAGGDQAFAFGGLPGDVPTVGDWNGDGKSKVGVFRAGFFWVLDANGNHTFDGTGVSQDLAFPFGGIAGDKPVVGKW